MYLKIQMLCAGSVVVHLLIAPEVGEPRKVLQDLEEQVKCPGSGLMTGKLTRKTKGLTEGFDDMALFQVLEKSKAIQETGRSKDIASALREKGSMTPGVGVLEDVVVAREKGLGGGFVFVDEGWEQGQRALAPHVPSRSQTVGAADSALHMIDKHGASSCSPVLLPRKNSSSPEELSEYIHVPHASAGGFPSGREVGPAEQWNSPRAAESARGPESSNGILPGRQSQLAVGPQANGAALGSLAGTSGRHSCPPEIPGAALRSLAGTSGRAKSPELSGVSSRRAAEKQAAEAGRRIEGLKATLKKMTQRELLRAFNVFISTVSEMRENRMKVSRVLGMLRNRKIAVAFHTFLEAAEASIAEKEHKRLAMLKWLYPGLQVAFDRWIWFTDDMRHEHRMAGKEIAQNMLADLGEAAGREAVLIVIKAADDLGHFFRTIIPAAG